MLKKLTNKKGFTLMEMLIVVAIIAVLVAIAIPTFNGALTKSKEAADTLPTSVPLTPQYQVQILIRRWCCWHLMTLTWHGSYWIPG